MMKSGLPKSWQPVICNNIYLTPVCGTYMFFYFVNLFLIKNIYNIKNLCNILFLLDINIIQGYNIMKEIYKKMICL